MIFDHRQYAPRCHLCQSQTDVLTGDGPPVCASCIEMRMDAVTNPATAGDMLVGTLAELHADVVSLVPQDGVLGWQWTPTWPGVGR